MKEDRLIIFNKYGGKCAYCGCELQKRWHVDHIQPIRRYGYLQNNTMSDRHSIDNLNPSCASCNINKHSMSLEQFRILVEGFMNHLNNISTQYKIAKRFGLVIETNIPVVFYFEKVKP